ncbi:BPSL0761 family protein [Stenotrophomonas acidaminiphila]
MTTATESIRHLIQTGAFLVDLALNDELPGSVRREASRLVRHYPTLSMVRLLAYQMGVKEEIPQSSWLEGYKHGPLTESLSDKVSRLIYE